MYHVSTQGVDERVINVHYYYYYRLFADGRGIVLDKSVSGLEEEVGGGLVWPG